MRDELVSDRLVAAAGQNVKQKKYWLEKLSGYPVNSRFPTDCKNTPGKTRRMETVTFRFTGETFIKLNRLSNNSDIRLYMILTTVLTALLSKYTGSNDIVMGSPIYRQAYHADFVNQVLILRNRLGENTTFKELLLETRKTIVEAVENYSYSIGVLLKELNIPFAKENDMSLFDIAVLLDNIHDKTYLQPVIRYMNVVFFFSKKDGAVEGTVEYNKRLYRKTTVERIVGHFKNILEDALFNSLDRPVRDLRLLTDEEKANLLYDFNDTHAQYPEHKTIHELFEDRVEKTPDRVALVGTRHESPLKLTYGELNEKSRRLARVMVQRGVRPGTVVGMMLERSVEKIIGILGILKAGGAYLPMDPEYPRDRIDFMMKDSNTHALVDRELLTGVLKGTVPAGPVELARPVRPRDTAYIIYTSGTTGKPKGVMIEHRSVVRLLFTDKSLFDFHGRDVWTLFHSYCFDFSVWEMYGALLFGGELVVVPGMVAKDPRRYLRVLRDHGVTVLNQTPSAFYGMVREELQGKDAEDADLALRYVIFGGEALSPGRLKEWRKRYPQVKLINMFGITETTVHVTYKEIGEEEIHSNISNIGTPIPTLSTYIFDKHRGLLPIGVPGELCVGGDGVARGYLNRPELTMEKFGVNPYKKGERLYRSGDLAKIDHTGEMEYLGRIDHQIQLRGFRIELGEIEDRLLKHPRIDDAVVVKRTGEEDDDYLCAYIVSKENIPVPGIREHLGLSLPDYMIPSYFVRLDGIPLTSNGKVDKKSLPLPRAVSTGEYTAPREKTEKTTAAIWEDVLGLEKVSVTDSYFDLGGDSIKAIKLLSRVNFSFDINLTVVDLFTNETVEKLALRVKHELGAGGGEERKQVLEELDVLKRELLSRELPAGDIEDIYPMSDIEKGMVFHSLKERERAVYHDQMVHKMRYVDFDPRRFEKALTLMVEKHQVLRTGFNVSDFGEPLQLVHRENRIDFVHEDLSGKTGDQREEYIRVYIEADRQNPIDVSTAPLWRMRTFALDKDNIVILWICHHAIIDGWSDASFKTELNNIYLELGANPGFRPIKLKSSYKDFVVDQLVRKKKNETPEYWKNELEDYKRFQFPAVDGADKTAGGMSYYYRDLGVPLLKALEKTAAVHNTRLKHLCFAAYLYMLSTFSFDDDIVTGLVTNNRPVSEDGDKILGCFLNTVPVRVKIPAAVTWSDYIRLVDRKLTELANHDRLSLFEIAKIAGDESHDLNPVFDILFNFTDFHVFRELNRENSGEIPAKTEEDNFALKGSTLTNTLFNFDIDLTWGDFIVCFTYSGAVTDRETVLNGYRNFGAILHRFVDAPGSIAGKESLMTEDEKKTLLHTFNRTRVDYPSHRTIHELFRDRAEKTPGGIAAVGTVHQSPPDELSLQLTYRELDEKSGHTGRLLFAKGVRAGDIVGIAAGRSIDMLIGILGILKAGGAYLPIDIDFPRERITYMLKDGNVKILLVEPSAQSAGLADIADLVPVSPGAVSPGAPEPDPVTPGAAAYVMYTSGSTGKPKGVMVEHRNAVRLVKNPNFIDLREGERLLMTGSIVFDIATFEIWGALLNGLSLYQAHKDVLLNPGKLAGVVVKTGISILHLIPQLFNQVLEHNDETFAGLDYFLVGGDLVKPAPVVQLRNKYPGLKIVHAYGPTENTTFSTTFRVDGDYTERLPIGSPISNSTVYIRDRNGKLQPIGVPGEISVGGDGVARGYLNNPELTDETFVHYPGNSRVYKTGDLGRWSADGNIQFLGRIDSQVKIRGHRVEVGEIERRLTGYDGLKEAVVGIREDEDGHKYLCAYFTSEESVDLNGLRNYLQVHLPGHMVPRYLHRLERIPLTSNGKIDRKALPHPEVKEKESYIPPDTGIETVLAGIWSEVLGVEKVGTGDNFFEIGGDSIKAIQVSARLLKHRLILDVKDLLSGADIKELALRVKKTQRDIHQGTVEGDVGLTPVQAGFFKNSSAHIHHFNQSLVLFREEGFDPVIVKDVLKKLVEHHDALRMVYKREGETVRQYNRAPDGKLFDYESMDVPVRENMEREIERHANRIQQGIDLENGPLLKSDHFKTPSGDYLQIVVHHLVVDGVSWRILLEDFETGYRLRQKGEEIVFQDKTDSFKYWSEKLKEYASSKKLLQELPAWRKIDASDIPALPVDCENNGDIKKGKYMGTLTVEFDKEDTGKLLKEVNHAYNTEINDILLTGLGLAVNAWSGNRSLFVNLEGHGREDILEDVNIFRTVGWFTSEYPVLIPVDDPGDIGVSIKQVKETLRAIPNKGTGYGILKYLTPVEKRGEGGFDRVPEIAFNYLGDFGGSETDGKGETGEKGLFTLSEIPGVIDQNPELEAPFAVQINGLCRDGVLSFSFSYNKFRFKRKSIETLANEYKTRISDIIDFCLRKEGKELTPSDYGCADIGIDVLDDFEMEMSGIE